MSRKHFREIARALRDVRPAPSEGFTARQQWRDTVRAIAGTLRTSNARFSFDRFYAACGFADDVAAAEVAA